MAEYEGELRTQPLPGRKRGRKFPPPVEDWTPAGNFTFFFRTMGGNINCIDANMSQGFGRKINHPNPQQKCNLKTKLVQSKDDRPRLFFVATMDIQPNEELVYDYNEKDPEVLKSNEFLLTGRVGKRSKHC